MEQQENDSGTDMMTVREVSMKLRISRWMVYQLTRNGQLASIKIGRRRLVLRHSVETFVKRLEEGGGL